MQCTTERRQELLNHLCRKKHDSVSNLMNVFKVSRPTIIRDIQVLACSYPIYTTRGVGGGVHIMNNFNLGIKYMTQQQISLLENLLLQLTGKEFVLMEEIIQTYKRPVCNQ